MAAATTALRQSLRSHAPRLFMFLMPGKGHVAQTECSWHRESPPPPNPQPHSHPPQPPRVDAL